ncbi:malto-oligosyltrehalose synthase [Planosporangium flavigriseum]|uniref:Malto-oligosyltrehalose synthase n=1 Tax=Planosporangium flavigriseum TaxID=373681 RepID=A0A8J3PNP1_9ACTN|nr:malto-oligosyltrehalose synthase [Planosporangium flavigriseum]NJC66434.1 malto-oligosyltrehalose synthase [Planosporangium flavigriseum]GIG74156.1 malto-oligosyltrehalose synthase [Planosporangium flavigriseum]
MKPVSTYRVQVRPGFDLAATAGLADYLAALGVSHLYTAPLLAATPGSEHGYDVVDPSRVNPQLGGEEGRRRLVSALRAAGLGLVVDIVPNHVGVAVPAASPAWWDVLRHGRESRYAGWFDIDWTRPRILLPVLGDGPDEIEKLKVVGDELHYYDHRFPLQPGTESGSPQEVHDRQHYELVSWRRGNSEINYRRFFAIPELAGLRVEDPAVFEATHRELLRWHAAGELDGIRVDHPDGLRDPAAYLRRLAEAAPGAWLVVEKILEVGEELPDWPVAGTTGYDALREVSGLFVDPSAEAAFPASDWAAQVHQGKRAAATKLLAAELKRLARMAPDVPDAEDALAEIAANFPVYRSYLPVGAEHLQQARTAAERNRPDLAGALEALGPRLSHPDDELAVRFQQYTGAVMAKGVEDTAFYRYSRFTALNEVGGDPGHFGVPPAEFHEATQARQARWPSGMTTLSTHDTKRSEDVRARLAVLSELPDEWATAVHRWMARAPLPDAAFAHLLWQAVVGAWPIERERLHAYAEKAAREASTSTSWADPDAEFERAMHAVVDAVYDDPALNAEISAFVDSITAAGWSNSLGQKLVQLTMPGVPDVYQGTELWDFSLVDPDNRRPVDFAARRDLLTRLDGGWQPDVDASGAAKLLVTSRALRLRRDHPELFTGYRPVVAEGPAASHVVAFDRGGAITVATRLPHALHRRGGWGETRLPLPGELTDVLTGRRFPGGAVPLAALLDRYPVALLAPVALS